MLESLQERLVAVTSLFSMLVAVIYFAIKKDVRSSLQMTVISLASLLFTLYNLNCVLNGGCTAWSWILTLTVGVFAVISIVMYGRLLELQLKGEMAATEISPLTRRVIVLQSDPYL
jgi:hypothetical protein